MPPDVVMQVDLWALHLQEASHTLNPAIITIARPGMICGFSSNVPTTTTYCNHSTLLLASTDACWAIPGRTHFSDPAAVSCRWCLPLWRVQLPPLPAGPRPCISRPPPLTLLLAAPPPFVLFTHANYRARKFRVAVRSQSTVC